MAGIQDGTPAALKQTGRGSGRVSEDLCLVTREENMLSDSFYVRVIIMKI